MIIRILCLFSALIFVGCATKASRLNDVSLGMNKSEVIKIMGSPHSTKGSDGIEVMVYLAYAQVFGAYHEYWVVLQNGKVSKYGRAGDFGTSEPARIIIDHNQTITTPQGK